MKKILGWIIAVLIIIAIALIGIFLKKSELVRGNVYNSQKNITLLNASTASTTSSAIDVRGAKKISFYIADNVPTPGKATSVVGIMASVDGTNYVNYNKLIDNVTNTNGQTLTRVETKSFSATGTAMLSMDLTSDTFYFIKASTTQIYGTGGAFGGVTVKTLVEY